MAIGPPWDLAVYGASKGRVVQAVSILTRVESA